MILVVAEQHGGALHRTTWEALAAAQVLAGDEAVDVLVPGADVSRAASEIAMADIGAVHAVQSAHLELYTADGYTQVCEQAIGELKPTYVIFPHTYRTRDFAPKLAARLRLPLVTDCVAVETSPRVSFVRPVFQGKATVQVGFRGTPPYLATIQVGAFDGGGVTRRPDAAPISPFQVSIDPAAIGQVPEPPVREERHAVDLSHAPKIVAVGRGIGSREQIALAERLAAQLGAEIAASRPICDSGWLPMERQIGSSGHTVAPRLYIALGISGAIQHVVGMKGSRTVVAINKDPDAPIFEVADYGIVGDLFEVVPAIIAELESGREATGERR